MLQLTEWEHTRAFDEELEKGVYTLLPNFPQQGKVGMNFKFMNGNTGETLLITLQRPSTEKSEWENIELNNAVLRDVTLIGGNDYMGNSVVYSNAIAVEPIINGEKGEIIIIKEEDDE